MNTYRKLFTNSILFGVGNLGSKLISIILVPLYTFYLSPEEYGTIDLINTSVLILIPIVSASMAEAVLRFSVTENYNDRSRVITNALVIFSIGFFAFLLFYPLFLFFNIFNDQLIFLYVLTAIQTVQGIGSQFLRGIGKIKEFAINGILTTFLVGGLNILFVVNFRQGISGYLASLVIAYFISTLFIIYYSKLWKYINFRLVSKNQAKIFLKYAIPLIPNTLMWWLINGSSRFMIGYFLGVSANGLFAVASKVPSLINIVTQVFSQAWQLAAIEEYDSKNIKHFYESVFNVYYKILFLSISGILVILKPLFNIIVDSAYYNAWQTVPFLLLGTVFSALAGFLGQIYIASMQTTGVFKTSIYAGVTSVLSGFILIPIMGNVGAGLSSVISFFVMFLVRYFDANKFINFEISWKNFFYFLILIIFQISIMFFSFNYKLEILISSILFITNIVLNKSFLLKLIERLVSYMRGRNNDKKIL